MLSYDPIPYTLQRTLVLTPCWPSSLSLSHTKPWRMMRTHTGTYSTQNIIRLLSTTLRRTNQRMGNRGRRSYHAAKPLNRNHAAKPRSHKTTWWHSLTADYQCHKAAKPKKKRKTWSNLSTQRAPWTCYWRHQFCSTKKEGRKCKSCCYFCSTNSHEVPRHLVGVAHGGT